MVDLKIKLPNGFLDEEIRCDHHVLKYERRLLIVVHIHYIIYYVCVKI